MPNKNTTLANLADIVNVDGNLLPTTVKIANLPVSTDTFNGICRPDNVTITVDSNGILSASGGGGGGGAFSSIIALWQNANASSKPAYSAVGVINNDGIVINLRAASNPGVITGGVVITLNAVSVPNTYALNGAFPNYSITIPVADILNIAAQTALVVTVGIVIGSQFNLVASSLTNIQPQAFTASVTGSFPRNSYPYYATGDLVTTTGTSSPNIPTSFSLSIAGQAIINYSSFTTNVITFASAPVITGTVTGSGRYGAGTTVININYVVNLPAFYTPAYYVQTNDLTPPVFSTLSPQTQGNPQGMTITYPIATAFTQYNWIAIALPLSRVDFVTAFGNTQLVPDVIAPSQSISGQSFNVFGFTKLDTASPAQLYITTG